MQNKPLTSKVALITGASRRIGAQIARVLHAEGMNIALHYNASEVDAATFCEELNSLRPHSAAIFRADLLIPESGKSLIQQAAEKWGRLDVLVNNASRFYRTLMGNVSEYAWDDLMNCNVKAPFFLSQAAAIHLAKQQGVIINIADIHAERPLRDYAVYCISKSALLMMTKALAKELGPAIRVNAVSPGSIEWPEGENALSDEQKEKIINQSILKCSGCADDIAKAVLYFVKDGTYVTGQVLNVDGGKGLCK